MKLKDLARLVDGTVVGNAAVEIKGVAPVEEAKSGDLVFVLDKPFLASALKCGASALLVPSNLEITGPPAVAGKSAIIAVNPRHAMAKILAVFQTKKKIRTGIDKTAVVPKSCRLGRGVAIGAYAILEENIDIGAGTIIFPHTYIGHDCRIGKNCVVHPHVTLYDRTIIGDRVILHSGCRLGIDGFGFVQEEGKHVKIPQIGNVIIEDDVELFANVCVSCATIGSTMIGAGTKIDNLSHVAHNCRIGKDCAVVSLVGFAGSVTLEDRVYVAGQAGFNGHVHIGESSVIMARAGVTKDVPAHSVVSGFPAQDHRQEIIFQAALRHLAKKVR
jgi:UDP-3-O-[3-hydroxymyristoyl] glucosamine N-acyltransferase